MYNQELGFYAFRQDTMSNPQWYERFDTKVDAIEAIGMTRQHKVLFEYVAQELHTQTFFSLTEAEQIVVCEDTEDHYLSYAFLRQSGIQHGNLEVNLQNYFTAGYNRYPKNRQQTLHLLDKYSKTAVQRTTQSEGTVFVQGGKGHRGGRGRGNRGGRGNKPFDKEYWKDKECFNCQNKGHPSTSCPEAEKDADDTSISSRSSQANIVTKLTKDFKKIKKAFSQLQQLQESDSDLSDDKDEEENSHFRIADRGFQFAQLNREFEPHIAKIFNQAQDFNNKLDLREIILFDSQPTIGFFFQPGTGHRDVQVQQQYAN